MGELVTPDEIIASLKAEVKALRKHIKIITTDNQIKDAELETYRKELRKLRRRLYVIRQFFGAVPQVLFDTGDNSQPTYEQLLRWYNRLRRLAAKHADKLGL